MKLSDIRTDTEMEAFLGGELWRSVGYGYALRMHDVEADRKYGRESSQLIVKKSDGRYFVEEVWKNGYSVFHEELYSTEGEAKRGLFEYILYDGDFAKAKEFCGDACNSQPDENGGFWLECTYFDREYCCPKISCFRVKKGMYIVKQWNDDMEDYIYFVYNENGFKEFMK